MSDDEKSYGGFEGADGINAIGQYTKELETQHSL
jgi:hypothetical protein